MPASPIRAESGPAVSGAFEYKGASGAKSLSTATTPEEISMRPRRPYVARLPDVTINRSGESAVITLYAALCPEPDVASQGATVEEVTSNRREAIELFKSEISLSAEAPPRTHEAATTGR